MDKKRALKVNLITIAVVLALILAAVLVTAFTPRKITPNAGPIEMNGDEIIIELAP